HRDLELARAGLVDRAQAALPLVGDGDHLAVPVADGMLLGEMPGQVGVPLARGLAERVEDAEPVFEGVARLLEDALLADALSGTCRLAGRGRRNRRLGDRAAACG